MRLFLNLVAILLLAMLASCGGGASVPEPRETLLAAPVMAPLGGKMVSGVPEGIFVSWTRNSEPEAAGYYLYRDVNPIPTPPPDDLMNPALRVNGGNLISQPPSGPSVSFTDLFDVTVGQTYYYRVTVVDNQGTESYPSNEMDWTVLGQTVTGLSPTQAFWGDDVTLTGDTFGTYNPATDHVLFQTANSGTIEGVVVSWDDTEIVATVPDNAITGPVYVVIDATIAATDEDLEILNPFISAIGPEVGFVEQLLTITGDNFGSLVGEVWVGTTNVTASVQDWSDTQIELLPPDGVEASPVTVVAGGLTTNGVLFTPRAEILSLSRPRAATTAEITIEGRYFGQNSGTVGLDDTFQSITQWEDRQLKFLIGELPGNYQLSVRTEAAISSNDVLFEVVGTPAVTMQGVDWQPLYKIDDTPRVRVSYPAETEAVWISVDGRTFYQNLTSPGASPFEFNLDPNFIPNGTRNIEARIYCLGVFADSNILQGDFYTLPGDIDASGLVDADDLASLRLLVGMISSDVAFRPWYDTDSDGLVTEADASQIGYAYGDLVAWPVIDF